MNITCDCCDTPLKDLKAKGIRIKGCVDCKCAFYCSQECFDGDWENHKKDCFSINEFIKICKKLESANLIRHVNGNTLDNRASNLQWVNLDDALQNNTWTVDAVLYLEDEEFELWEKVRALWKPHFTWHW